LPYKVYLTPTAFKELEKSMDWYDGCRDGLGARFTDAVNSRLTKLSENADIYPVVSSGYREVSIEKFPFLIVYKIIKKKNTIRVYHIFHTSRNPLLKNKPY